MLNYSAHALTEMRELHRRSKAAGHPDAGQILAFIEELRGAEKFELPDRGVLIHDPHDIPEGMEMTRLPYRVTAIEVPFSTPGTTGNTVASTKRIILAQEMLIEPARQRMRRTTAFETPNAIRIDVACWLDHLRVWNLQASGALVMIGARTEISEMPGDDPYADNRMGGAGFQLMPCARLADTVRRQIEMGGEEAFQHALTNDVGSEIRILAEMLTVLSCRNVSTRIEPAPEKLNRARAKSGKEPFFDTHVLVVGDARLSAGEAEDASGDGYKVRQHLRRGHIRRLPAGGRIWVNQTIVAPGSPKGEAEKIYRVKRP